MLPISIATKGKGVVGMLTRAGVISGRYGLTAAKMNRTLERFVRVLEHYDCGATFPITGAALARNKGRIAAYQERGVEFAIHGLYHIDYTALSLEQQFTHLENARRLFKAKGITYDGFRSPYLRSNAAMLAALRQTGFLYEGSQAMYWDVIDGANTAAYHRALEFYGAISATDLPCLPKHEDGLVRVPYCLPDDEALVDRLRLKSSEAMIELWLNVLEETYRLGEIFTVGLHPERFDQCEAPLAATLRKARQLAPAVWIAKISEVARWWKSRLEATVTVLDGAQDEYLVRTSALDGLTFLARKVQVLSPAEPWDKGYFLVSNSEIQLRSSRRPFIGVSRTSSLGLPGFLVEQGYIVEFAEGGGSHSLFLDRPSFNDQDERPLLTEIENGDFPLVKLGRWPNGAKSALSVTGDIDALTIWDYGLRFLGN